MYKSCSRCGKIHDSNYKCTVGKAYDNAYKTHADNLRNTHAWHKKSKEIKEKSKYLCAVCQEEGIYTYDNLEIHHIIKLRDNKELLLDNNNLICLCWKHHKLADEGYIDADYLRILAANREHPPTLGGNG